MEDIINEKKRKYIIDGIMKDIVCSSEEKPVFKLLGSTDRKGYTVATVCSFMGERMEAYTNIEPFENQEDVRRMIQKIEEEGKYKLANEVFKKWNHA